MSLYNAMHGFDPNARLVLKALWINAESIARFRDAYVDPENNEFVILTRTGGGNRETYQEENAELAKHPRYIDDSDDDFDSTFALFRFEIPEGVEIPSDMPKAKSLKEKTEEAIARMEKKGGQ